jgi:IS5 family transposase
LHRALPNLLKGQVGDEINVLMAACAWNLRKWLVIATIFLFWQKLGLFFVMATILDTGRR